MHQPGQATKPFVTLQRKTLLGMSMGLLLLDSVAPGQASVPAGNFINHPPTPTPTAWAHQGIVPAQSHPTAPPVAAHFFKPTKPDTGNGLWHHLVNTTAVFNQLPAHAAINTTEVGQTGRNLSLDLTSVSQDIILGSKLFASTSSVTINIGGIYQVFHAGSTVTAGEYVAIKQVLSSEKQTVTLGSGGAALGGTFDLNAFDGKNVISLVIPANVSAIDYIANHSVVRVNGDLTNYGSIYEASTGSRNASGSIYAQDIVNESGAIISSILPASLSGLAPNNGNSSLNLQAVNDIVNAGSITASGSINLAAGSGHFTNSGSLTAVKGDINFASPSDINIQATGGSFNATTGNINIRDASYEGADNVLISGGDYNSQNLNIHSGGGTINGTVGQVTGNLNTAAAVEHFAADTQNLVLGNNIVKGDPTFASSGDITISGANVFGEDVAIVAQGNIIAGDNAAQIMANGHNVTLIAGATVTSSGTINAGGTDIPGSALNISGGSGTGNGTGSFAASVDFSAPTGGNISLQNSNASVVIDTSSGAGNAGNVTLIAEAKGAGTGQVLLNSLATINAASGAAGASGGNVTVIAGATGSGNNLTVGNISTAGGAGGVGGSVALLNETPTTSAGPVATFDQSGKITSSGAFIGAGGTSANSSTIATGNIVTGGGDLSAFGGTFNIGTINAGTTGTVTYTGTGSINVNNSITAKAVNLTAGDAVAAGGAGGSVSLNAGSSITASTVTLVAGKGGNADAFSSGGLGGSVTLAGNISGTLLTVTGGNGGSDSGLNKGGGAGGGIMVSGNINEGTANLTGGTGGPGQSGGSGGAISLGGSNSGGTLTATGGAGGTDNGELGAAGAGGAVTNSATLTYSNVNLTGGAGGAGSGGGAGGAVTLSTPFTATTANLTGGNGGAGTSPTGQGGDGGAVSLGATVSAALVTVTGGMAGTGVSSPGNGGNVSLAGINGQAGGDATTVSIYASNGGTITGGGQILTNSLILLSGSGAITTIITDAATLSASTSSNVSISDSASTVTLAGANSASDYSLMATGSIIIGTALSALTLTGSSSVELTSITGSILAGNASSQINTPTLSFSAASGSAGSLAVPIATSASALTLTAGGGAYLTDGNSAVSIYSSSASVFQLTATAANATIGIATGQTLKADSVVLQGVAGNIVSITIDGNIIGQSGGNASNVALQAFGSTGTITDGSQGSPTIATNSLTLTAENGSIGTSVSPIQTNATALAINTSDTTNGAFVNDISNGSIVLNSSSSGSVFALTAPNAAQLNISQAITTGSGSTNQVILTSGGNLTFNAALTTGTLNATAGGNIFINNSLSGNNIIITTSAGSSGSIVLAANVTATGASASIAISADGNGTITQPTGTIITQADSTLSLSSGSSNIGSAAAPIQTNAPQITASTTGNVNINDSGSVTIAGSNQASNFVVNSAGNITLGTKAAAATVAGTTAVTLVAGGTGNAILNGNSSSEILTAALSLTTNGGNIGASSGNGSILTSATSLSVSTGGTSSGDAYIVDSTANVLLNASSARSLTLALGAGTLTSNGSSNFGTSVGGAFNLTAGGLNLDTGDMIKAYMINVTGGDTLVIGGTGGTLWGTDAVDSGTSAPTAINLAVANEGTLAAPNSIIFASSVTLKTGDGSTNNQGTVNINAQSSNFEKAIVIDAGVTVASNGVVQLNSCRTDLSGTLSAPTVMVNCPFAAGVIANSAGNVDLSTMGNLVFQGQALAIIASGNIIDTATATIDLSSSTGSGGALTLVAGYDFTPATVGQTGPGPGVYTFASVSTKGGNIEMGSVTINTASAVGNGGAVVAVAVNGGSANGNISLSGITTSANGPTGTSGSVTVVGPGTLTLGFITTHGSLTTTDADVTIAGSTPSIVGAPKIVFGELQGGSFVPGATSIFSSLALGGMNAGGAVVNLTAGGSITSTSTITADTLNLVLGPIGSAGSSGQPLNLQVGTINASGSQSSAFLKDSYPIGTDHIIIGDVNVATFSLDSVNLGTIVNVDDATLSAATISLTASTINVTSADSAIRASNGGTGQGGSITILAGTVVSATNQAILLDADGKTEGGQISVTVGGTPSVETLGTGANQFMLSALPGVGSKGGSVSFSTPGVLQIMTDAAGNIPSSVISISPALPIGGPGGSITLSAQTINWGVTGTGNATPLNLSANGLNGSSGGAISVTLTGPQSNPAVIGNAPGDFNLSASGSSGGSVSFSTIGPMALVLDANNKPTGINVAPTFQNGGSIILSANNYTWGTDNAGTNGTTTTPIVFNVDGLTGFSGGEAGFVSITQLARGVGAVIGTGAGQFDFSARGGSNFNLATGSGVSFESLGSLLVNPSGIDVTAVGSFANGSNISLVSNSSTTFNYGLNNVKNTNGVLGTLSVAGINGGNNGNLSLINIGGALTNSVAITAVNNLTMISGDVGALVVGQNIGNTKTASITLGSDIGNITSTKTILTDNDTGVLNVSSTGGNIGSLTFTSAKVNANAPFGSITLIDKVVSDANVVSVVLGAVNGATSINTGAGKAFSFTTGIGITSSVDINAGTALTLKTTSKQFDLGLFGSLEASGTNSVISITAPNGIIAFTPVDISANKSVTIASTGTNAQIILDSIGNTFTPSTVSVTADELIQTTSVNALTSLVEKVTSTNLSSINVNGDVLVSNGSITMTTPTKGLTGIGGDTSVDLSAAKSITLTTGGTVTLGTIGAQMTPTTVKISAGEALTVAGTIASVGNVSLATSSATAGNMTLNNIKTANGTITAIAAGPSLVISADAVIKASSTGSLRVPIKLENKNTTKGTIQVNGGADIETFGPKGSNVSISIGSPTATNSAIPAAQTGVTFTPSTVQSPPVFFFGKNGVNFGNGVQVISVNGGQVIFNTGKLDASAIAIDGGGTIIKADPPGMSMGTPQLSVPGVVGGQQILTVAGNAGLAIAPSIQFFAMAPTAISTTPLLSSALLSPSLLSPTVLSPSLLLPSVVSLSPSLSSTAIAATRTLYGECVDYDSADNSGAPVETIFINRGGRGNSSESNIEAMVFAGKDLNIAGPQKAEFATHHNTGTNAIDLRKGNALIAPIVDSVVNTNFGKVQVKANSIALIMAMPAGTAVYNLDDSKNNSVVMIVGEQKLALAPGHHGVATSMLVSSYEMINPAEGVFHRNVKAIKLGNGLQAFTSEFSLISAIGNVTQLRQLVSSSNAEAKRLAAHLLKTCAIMSQLQGSQGFAQYRHPRLSASADLR